MSSSQNKKDGVSLRTLNILLIIGAVSLSGLMFFSTFHLSSSFRQLTETSERQIELRKSALDLMDASDYLTEKVQRFAVHGDMKYLEAYFNEAFETQRREEAIAKMSENKGCEDALNKLQSAMDSSLELMNREYYAMRLVIEAKGYTQYPELLKSVTLSEEDRALDADGKMRRAAEMVFDNEYYDQKDRIRNNMHSSLKELENMVYTEDALALESLRTELVLVRVVIALQVIGMVFLVCMTSRLGIRPILKAVDRIKENSRIPVIGANEFRYLARVYNKMYDVYKSSLENLNYKASHDELTGAYNRLGYDLLISSIDLRTTYMILIDVDNFKSINDTYGHETGDRILIKLAQTLKKHFRSDDHICRIGGDEFVVFMVHTDELQNDLIAAKIEEINHELEMTDDGLPATSISVGIVHGSDAPEAEKLFKKTDAALYRSKRKGKHTYTFQS
ncbi:MAG: GGDEF domain-containing protein [Clostridia bacterium]|nr:GGDEF domain-containing protein [Clostridia bacterium]